MRTRFLSGLAIVPLLAAPAFCQDLSSASGVVLETTNASRYTYVRIDTGTAKLWAAGPAVAVKSGERVTLRNGLFNTNFYSATLKKTFEEIYFVEKIVPAGAAAAGTDAPHAAAGLPHGHPTMGAPGTAAPTNLVIAVIRQPDGGKSIAEVWAQKAQLGGKSVVVRGKVVKSLPNILGRTWLHLRDGTGAEGQNDLTVTTKASAAVGDVVTVTGIVATDKDFGGGYKYAVIVEDATVTP